MKILKQLTLCILLYSLSPPIMAFDFTSFIKELFSARAGGKAVDSGEGSKDIENFRKPNRCQNHYPWGESKIKDGEVLKRILYLCRNSYSIEYDPMAKIALSVSEVLTKPNILYSKYPSVEKFIPDPELPNKIQASLADYKVSGYDKASLAASVNMSIYNEGLSEEQLADINQRALDESFYLSNTAAMTGPNMKYGIWAELEAQVRYWASQKDNLYVITGPIFIGGKVKGFMKESKTAIPTHFYKIVTDPLTHGSVAYIVPNQEIMTPRNNRPQNVANAFYCAEKKLCELNDFVVSIKEIEKLTALEFYPVLAPYYAVQVKQDVNEIYKYKKKIN